ncbi:hypothetical protein ACHHYP_03382 [Achlya hypogyna]|uniref:Uncharacterized protein n=1 Tax=Achlya hypogyna TaxID=1202772 RepID=A0A1V9ZRE3_ACHHY|nr:hypothetical protein ACHHYP_03382 [Achlya hypogyna]
MHSSTPPSTLKFLVGFVYFVATVALGVVALAFMLPYLENDYLWPEFTSSTLATRVVQIFNDKLVFADSDLAFDLLAASVIAPPPAALLQPVYPRKLLHEELTTPVAAIRSLRNYDVNLLTFLMTGYCWADLYQLYSMAHTSARAVRCQQQYSANAAVYLEAVLRNVDFQAWLDSFGGEFYTFIADPIAEMSSSGAAWKQQLLGHVPAPVEDEVALWTSLGLTTFALQYANRIETGLVETITITNALGQTPSFQLKTLPSVHRGTFWTSSYLFAALQTDFVSLEPNHSLVRNSSTFFGLFNPSELEAYNDGSPLNRINAVLHDQLGQLTSVDLVWLPRPPAIVATVRAFHNAVATALVTTVAFASAWDALESGVWTPTPAQWQRPNIVFYGGNPMCSFGSALPIVQESFGFDDACGTQSALTLQWSPLSGLFAIAATGANDTSACRLLPLSEQLQCHRTVAAALEAAELLSPILKWPLPPMDLGVLQFVAPTNGNITIEIQSLLDPAFELFGAVMLCDWAVMNREAVGFQGDEASFNLVSKFYAPVVLPPAQVTTGLSGYLWRCAAVTTVGISLVAVLLVVLWLWFQPHHVEWFLFNRLVGTVWLSRSILAGRSLTALLCLATSDVTFAMTPTSLSQLHVESKTLFRTCLFASETLWITYIAHEILHPVVGHRTHRYAAPSSLLAWVALVLYTQLGPVPFTATVDRQCHAVDIDVMVLCTSGSIHIATIHRTLALVLITLGAVIGGAVVAWLSSPTRVPVMPMGSEWKAKPIPSLALPVSAVAFVHEAHPHTNHTALDAITSACCGMFYFSWRGRRYLFDTKSWLLVPSEAYGFALPKLWRRDTATIVVLPHLQGGASTNAKAPKKVHASPAVVERWTCLYTTARRALGFPCLLLSLFSNIAYLGVAQTNLANDYIWAGFNATGTYAFLGNLFNRQLLTTSVMSFQLDDPAYSDVSQRYNTSVATIRVGGTAAHRQLFAADVDFETVVTNLRNTDPCVLPWVFTQYCYVDWRQRWSLASTAARQRRCDRDYATNGAVYLESGLGNLASWDAWSTCWGDSFEAGIARALRSTGEGRAWLEAIRATPRSVADEVAHWRAMAIHTFVLQWQNFKTTGFTDSFYIENALGLQYPLLLSETSGSMHLRQQTSLRLYWTLASDLWAVASNSTRIGGASLVRDSAFYAFANATPEVLLFDNMTLVQPLNAGLTVLRESIGPFGSVDTEYVPVPLALRQFYAAYTGALSTLLVSNADATDTYAALPSHPFIMEVPGRLLAQSATLMSVGGRIMCGNDAPPYPFMYGIATLFGARSLCYALFPEQIETTPAQLLFALYGFNATHPELDFNAMCALDMAALASCAEGYAAVWDFIKQYVENLQSLRLPAMSVEATVLDLNISLVQYLQNVSSTEVVFFTINILAPEDAWPFYGWCLLFDWVTDVREVVSYQGDAGVVTAISSPMTPATLSPKADTISRSLSVVSQGCVQYVTGTLILVAGGAMLIALYQRLRVASVNLMVLTRLAGLVWIGRPLLLVRSLTAICLLNTSPLELVQHRAVLTKFVSPRLAWYDTVLAASELTWTVFILNDVLSCVTQQYTVLYASRSTHLAWIVAILWTLLSPQRHAAQIRRVCTAINMDDGLVCTSGFVQIGNVHRVVVGFGVGVASVVVCYTGARLLYRDTAPGPAPTLLLNAQSFFMLTLEKSGDDVFLDKMSAFVAGVLSWEVHGTLHMLDLKTWRYVRLTRDAMDATHPPRLRQAIPLSKL